MLNTIRGSKANDPDTGLGIEKQYSTEAIKKIVDRRKKVKLSIATNSGKTILGSIYVPDDVRPSDFLRSSDIKSQVVAGKTGYNSLAGYCLAIKFSLESGHEFVSVVLNSSSIRNRFVDSENIIKKVEKIYQ